MMMLYEILLIIGILSVSFVLGYIKGYIDRKNDEKMIMFD